MTSNAPVIGIASCARPIAFGDYPPLIHQTVFSKYVDFVQFEMSGVPLLIPALEAPSDKFHHAIANSIDGLLLPGSPSNVGHRLQGDVFRPVEIKGLTDHARDLTVLPLIRLLVEQRVPILGLCRGMQELNVALGGDLYQEVHKEKGVIDHRSDKGKVWSKRYEPSHFIHIEPYGFISKLMEPINGDSRSIEVNSLHGQAISTLGVGVNVEARSNDGVVEAISYNYHDQFALGVQWHLEWRSATGRLEQSIIKEYREVCMKHRAERLIL